MMPLPGVAKQVATGHMWPCMMPYRNSYPLAHAALIRVMDATDNPTFRHLDLSPGTSYSNPYT